MKHIPLYVLCLLLFLLQFPWIVFVVIIGFPMFILLVSLSIISVATHSNYEFKEKMFEFCDIFVFIATIPIDLALKLIK